MSFQFSTLSDEQILATAKPILERLIGAEFNSSTQIEIGQDRFDDGEPFIAIMLDHAMGKAAWHAHESFDAVAKIENALNEQGEKRPVLIFHHFQDPEHAKPGKGRKAAA